MARPVKRPAKRAVKRAVKRSVKRAVRHGFIGSVLCMSLHAHAACVIDVNDEITNPFEPGCGDLVLTYTENDNSGNNIALGFPVPSPIASLTPVDGFRDYDSLFARHQSLLAAHDEVTGQSVGRTVAGRDIWAYVVSDADTLTADGFAEGAVLVNGGIHAREWQTPEAVTAVLETLVERKAQHGLEQYLIENLATVLLPVNNVDGFLETQRYPDRVTAHRDQPRAGRMRRKNLRHPGSQGATRCGSGHCRGQLLWDRPESQFDAGIRTGKSQQQQYDQPDLSGYSARLRA